MSERRAYRVARVDRSSVRHHCRRPDDGELLERLKSWRRSASGSAIAGFGQMLYPDPSSGRGWSMPSDGQFGGPATWKPFAPLSGDPIVNLPAVAP